MREVYKKKEGTQAVGPFTTKLYTNEIMPDLNCMYQSKVLQIMQSKTVSTLSRNVDRIHTVLFTPEFKKQMTLHGSVKNVAQHNNAPSYTNKV